jgi:hypothetical protein
MILEYTPANESVSARVEAMRGMLASRRESAERKFDKFASKQNKSDISLPSSSLRAMLDKVKVSARENAAQQVAGANAH